jgi:mRNA-degrading endonuclease RelE of RelBE toxin-antitoxin system
MSYKILTIPPFDRQLKRLSKKYQSLKEEFFLLIERLEENPEQGTNLGNNCFKIRLSVTSKGKGKSGGARVITNIVISDEIVYLLAIYDKSEKENLTDNELEELMKLVAKKLL